jgi:hypothetical protein
MVPAGETQRTGCPQRWNFVVVRPLVLALLFLLAGCAGVAPVPGGNETRNDTYYASEQDLKSRLDSMKPGMPRDKVFDILGRNKQDFVLLDRHDIRLAVLGGDNALLPETMATKYGPDVIRQLTGYRLYYKSVKRDIGFASPIRLRTDERGFDYALTLIFRRGVLFEDPLLSGGIVKQSHSRTLFDILTPALILGATVNHD